MVFNIKILLFSRGIKFFSNCKKSGTCLSRLVHLRIAFGYIYPGKKIIVLLDSYPL